MRLVEELSRGELLQFVNEAQTLFYADWDAAGQPIWNPDKQWDGAEVCQELAWLLSHFGAVPEQTVSRTID